MAQIRWSLTAGTDLQGIEDFIARDSALHAVAFVDSIVESVELLLKAPVSIASSLNLIATISVK